MRWIGRSDDESTVTLRRFAGEFVLGPRPPEDGVVRQGAVIDVETTGLDRESDEVIEVGIRRFEFDRRDGRVVGVGESLSALQQPSAPLSDEIQQLTGLTDEALAGQSIDWEAAAALLAPTDVIIAHNAAFDRPFIDRNLPDLDKVWACSVMQVGWLAHGFSGAKLELLSHYHGFFVDAHRALADADATLHLLSMEAPGGGVYLAELLDAAREPWYKVWATGSAFETKDLLRARHYRWDAEKRCWWRRVIGEDALTAENAWLSERIYRGKRVGDVEHIAPKARFR